MKCLIIGYQLLFYFAAIKGYLKQTFRAIESRFGNMIYGSAALTDGNIRINIEVTNYNSVEYKPGAKLTVTGIHNDTGEYSL